MTTTRTVTAATSAAIADAINADFAAGEAVTVNGRRITSRFGRKPANAWLNGTVSVTVEGRSARTTGTVYAKPGQDLTTTPEPCDECGGQDLDRFGICQDENCQERRAEAYAERHADALLGARAW